MTEGYIILNAGLGAKRIIKVYTPNIVEPNDTWIILYENNVSRTEYLVNRKYLFCGWEDAINYLENEVEM